VIPVGRLAPADQWDQNLLGQLFDNKLYPTGLTFRRFEGYPNAKGCCLLIPSRYWHQHTDQITEAIERYDWCLAFRCGDEEDLFDVSQVSHPNIRWWVQTPRKGREYPVGTRFIGVGFPPHFNDLSEDVPEKDIDVALIGQNTHQRRRECFEALEKTMGSQFVKATSGFTESWREGAGPGDYAFQMMKAKTAPCPSGAVSPDSFRFWVALEAHCVPIADMVSPVDGVTAYWHRLFPDCPFPLIENYSDLAGYVEDALKGWPRNANRIAAWYMQYKRRLSHWLADDLTELGAI
jgi:hypothetical protein